MIQSLRTFSLHEAFWSTRKLCSGVQQLGVKEKTFVDPEKSAAAEEGGEGGKKEGAAEDEEGAGEKAEADAEEEAEGSPRAGAEGEAGVPPIAVVDEVEEVEMKPEPPRELPPEGPEYDALKNRLKEFDLDWAIVATTVASIGIQPTEIGADALDADQLFVVTCRTIESAHPLSLQASHVALL